MSDKEPDNIKELSHEISEHILQEWYKVHNEFNFAFQEIINKHHVGYETTYVTLRVVLNHLERHIRLHYGVKADRLLQLLNSAAEAIEIKSEEVGKTSAKEGTYFSSTGF